MKTAKLKDMKKGWLVGDFEPSLHRTKEFEVAVKSYKAGEYEKKHYHKIAREITVIVSGEARMNGRKYSQGDIIIIEPNEATDFEALKDTVTTVIKIPGVKDDKYFSDGGK